LALVVQVLQTAGHQEITLFFLPSHPQQEVEAALHLQVLVLLLAAPVVAAEAPVALLVLRIRVVLAEVVKPLALVEVVAAQTPMAVLVKTILLVVLEAAVCHHRLRAFLLLVVVEEVVAAETMLVMEERQVLVAVQVVHQIAP
jgi:hypothetical protein